MLSSASDKVKLFAEIFSKNSNLDDSGISLPVFPSRTNLKLLWSWYLRMLGKCLSLAVVSKVFEKLVNNRIVDHLEKCGLFSDFQYIWF